MAQRLKVYQSLWAMERRQPGVAEESLEQQCKRVFEAKFDGVCIDPSVEEISQYADIKSLCEKYSLDCMVNAFPNTIDDLGVLLNFAQRIDAQMVNIIGGIMPLTVEQALPTIHRWMADAKRYKFPVLFETHRDSLLNDLFFTLQVLDQVPDIRLCADLSHFVIDRETRLPLSTVDREYYQRILDHSDCFQGRVASREQIQVQIDFVQHQEWVLQFKQWWRDGLHGWRRRNADDATLIFLCELGPPPYAMTDANQQELSDRFAEALTIRQWVTQIWADFDG